MVFQACPSQADEQNFWSFNSLFYNKYIMLLC